MVNAWRFNPNPTPAGTLIRIRNTFADSVVLESEFPAYCEIFQDRAGQLWCQHALSKRTKLEPPYRIIRAS